MGEPLQSLLDGLHEMAEQSKKEGADTRLVREGARLPQ